MSLSVGVSGSNKTVSALSVGVGGAWKSVAAGWVGVGGVWKEFYNALIASLSNNSATSYELTPSTASASFLLNSDGRAQKQESGVTTDVSGEWLVSGAASSFEARATVTSGSLTSGTTGSWLALSSSRSWILERGSVGLSTCQFTLEIRRTTDSVVVATATITLSAEVDL